MKESENIYSNICNVIANSIKEDWLDSILVIEYTENYQTFEGTYTNLTGQILELDVGEISVELDEEISELYEITVTGHDDRWNELIFYLSNNGALKVYFIWNQDFQNGRLEQNSK
ncbi:MAG: hypothetical protein ACK5MW_09585 [Enterococcus sp.]